MYILLKISSFVFRPFNKRNALLQALIGINLFSQHCPDGGGNACKLMVNPELTYEEEEEKPKYSTYMCNCCVLYRVFIISCSVHTYHSHSNAKRKGLDMSFV